MTFFNVTRSLKCVIFPLSIITPSLTYNASNRIFAKFFFIFQMKSQQISPKVAIFHRNFLIELLIENNLTDCWVDSFRQQCFDVNWGPHTILNMYTAVKLWELHRSPEQFLHDIRHSPPQVHTPVAIRTILYYLCIANTPLDTPAGNFSMGEGILGEPDLTKV